MKIPSTTEKNVAFMHGVWLRSQVCTGEGRMLADLSYEVADLTEKLLAVEDLNKRLMVDPWGTPETAPKNRTRVLAAFVGVYEPITGSISDGRFYPDGMSGSQPFSHWMPLPKIGEKTP